MATLTYTHTFGAIADQFYASYSFTAGLTGKITDVGLTLIGLDHSFAGDLDIVLVSPNRVSLMVMSDIGGSADLEDATLALSDGAAQALPVAAPGLGAIAGGAYRPTTVGSDETMLQFGGGAPGVIDFATGTGSVGFATAFGGDAAAGVWSLIISDDAASDTGHLDRWALTLTSDAARVALVGEPDRNVIEVIATSATAGRYLLNGEIVTYSGVTGFDIAGGDGANLLIGGAGADSLTGGRGFDRLYGGAGNDRLAVSTPFDLQTDETYDGGGGTDVLALFFSRATLDLRYVTLAGIEQVALGFRPRPDQHVLILTAAQFQALQRIDGRAGDGDEAIDLRMGAVTTLNLGAVTLTGMADLGDVVMVRGDESAETITGSALRDELRGRSGADGLSGGAGTDLLAGGNGDDRLAGGAGADSLDGGAGSDSADYSASATGVTVRLWNGTGAGGDAQGDALVGVEHVTGSAQGDSLIGDDLAGNWLTGGGGTDYINGLGGADRLNGQSGNDTLEGGNGADQYVFGPGYGHDRVVQFLDGVDRVDLVGLTFAQFSEATFGTGVRLTGSGAAAGLILDLGGVTMAQITAGDFI